MYPRKIREIRSEYDVELEKIIDEWFMSKINERTDYSFVANIRSLYQGDYVEQEDNVMTQVFYWSMEFKIDVSYTKSLIRIEMLSENILEVIGTITPESAPSVAYFEQNYIEQNKIENIVYYISIEHDTVDIYCLDGSVYRKVTQEGKETAESLSQILFPKNTEFLEGTRQYTTEYTSHSNMGDFIVVNKHMDVNRYYLPFYLLKSKTPADIPLTYISFRYDTVQNKISSIWISETNFMGIIYSILTDNTFPLELCGGEYIGGDVSLNSFVKSVGLYLPT